MNKANVHRQGCAEPVPQWKFRVAILVDDLAPFLNGCHTLLNLGCGTTPLHASKRPLLTVGVDGNLPSLRSARRDRTHDQFVLADLRRLPFRGKSMDGVAALDSIEHLEKASGLALLDEMERVARRRVVVLTPNGFLPKGELEDGNPLQAHRSGWCVSDFASRGFTVVGRHGLKALRGEHAEIRWQPRLLWRLVSYMSQPFVKRRPEHAFHLLAYRDSQGGSEPRGSRLVKGQA